MHDSLVPASAPPQRATAGGGPPPARPDAARTRRHLLLLRLHIAKPPLVCIALVVQLVPLARLQTCRGGISMRHGKAAQRKSGAGGNTFRGCQTAAAACSRNAPERTFSSTSSGWGACWPCMASRRPLGGPIHHLPAEAACAGGTGGGVRRARHRRRRARPCRLCHPLQTAQQRAPAASFLQAARGCSRARGARRRVMGARCAASVLADCRRQDGAE